MRSVLGVRELHRAAERYRRRHPLPAIRLRVTDPDADHERFRKTLRAWRNARRTWLLVIRRCRTRLAQLLQALRIESLRCRTAAPLDDEPVQVEPLDWLTPISPNAPSVAVAREALAA